MTEVTDLSTGEVHMSSLQIETSDQIDKLMGSLAKAQTKIEHATKDSTNPGFKSKFASLASVFEACRTPLAENGIAIVQAPFNAGGDIGVATILGHESGQWMKCALAVKPVKFDAQGAGSVITYLRRYTLSAMVGVAPHDDDGEAAVGRPDSASPGRLAKPPTTPAAAGTNTAHPKRKEAEAAFLSLKKRIKTAPWLEALDAVVRDGAKDFELVKEVAPVQGYEALMALVAERRQELTDQGMAAEAAP